MSKAKAPAGVSLRYVGDGAWIRGVPARDLDSEEIARLHLNPRSLLASGLYEPAKDAESGKESDLDV
jgi:hypothetical protein